MTNHNVPNRRDILRVAAAAGFAGALPLRAAAAPPPETTVLRLSRFPSLCLAPLYVAEALLHAEGFDDIRYVGEGMAGAGVPGALALGAGEVDMAVNFVAPMVIALDQGAPIVLLGGLHVGCFQVFGSERVRSVSDLKGKTVAMSGTGSTQYIFLASIATSVGLDPQRDIAWYDIRGADKEALIAQGRIDAHLAFPPESQELRARKVGRVLLDSTLDRPWSQYFCCLVAANRAFVRRNPIAAKRALRAILKASELCVGDPDLGVQAYLARGFAVQRALARQAITELPYGHWREYNPEETLRFYALRLREAGMVKAAPARLIAQGTDWRFVEELKREMKT